MRGKRHEKLQLKLLSKNGELLNVINCFAGQVTVFRAASDQELAPYQRALAGIPGPEKFLILLDDRPFRAEEHLLIGFGEHFVESDGLVEEFLANSNVPAAAVGPLLMSFGLEQTGDRLCSQLNPDLAHRLRLLAAVHSPDKVLILNTPFEPIAGQWKERFAELVASTARTKGQIVVVPRLYYRPASWIDNEFIARVQVGETLQRTIGYGSAPSDVNEVLQKLRAEHAARTAAAAPAAAPPVPAPVESHRSYNFRLPVAEVFEFIMQRPRRQLFGSAALLLLLALVPLLLRDRSNAHRAPRVEATDTGTAVVVSMLNQRDQTEPEAQIPTPIPAVPDEAAPPPGPRYGPVLAHYPEPIQEAVMASFEGRLVPAGGLRRPAQPLPLVSGSGRREDKSKSNLFALLESASGPEQPSSGSGGMRPMEAPPAEIDPGMDPEAKRELIHQKFLEAIRRASERRQDEGM